MAETDTLIIGGGGSGSGLHSPWKKPVEKPAESPVMGEVTWPSLSDVQLSKPIDVPIADPQVLQISSGNNKKSNGGGSRNSSHKNGQPRYNRGGSKRNQNGTPAFPVPLVPHGYPPVVPTLRPIPVHGYVADNHIGKSGSQIPVKGFGHQLHAIDASGSICPPAPGDPTVSAPKYSFQKTNIAEGGGPGGHMHSCWQNPWQFGPRGGIIVQQNMAPKACMRPAFFGPAPFGAGPPFPGNNLIRCCIHMVASFLFSVDPFFSLADESALACSFLLSPWVFVLDTSRKTKTCNNSTMHSCAQSW